MIITSPKMAQTLSPKPKASKTSKSKAAKEKLVGEEKLLVQEDDKKNI